jgi:uncharacterized protein YoxC
MTPFVSPAIHLALRAAAVADTIWVEKPIAKGTFDKITSIASGVMTLTILVLAIALVPAAWNFRKTYKKTSALLTRVQADVAPLMKHAHAIADNVNYISTAVRADIAMIHDTLVSANRRLEEAVAVTERRMHDFNALLAVAQQEAEGVFVSTAATVHGVRRGASHFAGDNGPELASVEVDDGGLEVVVDDEEIADGNDSVTYDDPDAPRAPRVVRRSRAR